LGPLPLGGEDSTTVKTESGAEAVFFGIGDCG
jgi:hypothetical protein